jgi:hypothetical protein
MKILIFKGTLHFPNSLSHPTGYPPPPPEVKNLYKEFVVKVLFADRPHKILSSKLELLSNLCISDYSLKTFVLILLLRPSCHPILAHSATVICSLSQMAYTLGKSILKGIEVT